MNDLDLNIRTAVVADVELILNLIRQKAEFDGNLESLSATTERLKQTLFAESPLATVLLAEIKGEVVGYALFFDTYSSFLAQPSIWLDDLFVLDSKRGRGIGMALLNHLAKIARAKNCGRLEWTVNTFNSRGIEFYQRFGAKIFGQIDLCRLDRELIDQLASC